MLNAGINGKLYAIGGENATGPSTAVYRLDIDGSTYTWTSVAP